MLLLLLWPGCLLLGVACRSSSTPDVLLRLWRLRQRWGQGATWGWGRTQTLWLPPARMLLLRELHRQLWWLLLLLRLLWQLLYLCCPPLCTTCNTRKSTPL
jgi:hypothetical protein